MVHFELPQTSREPAVGESVVLVPEEVVGLCDRVADAAAELLLAAQEVERGNHGVRIRLPVELGVVGGKQGVVERADEAAVLDVLLAPRAVEPELVLDDRTTEVKAVVLDVVDVVAVFTERVGAAFSLAVTLAALETRIGLQGLGEIGRLPLLVGDEVAAAAVELVGAALRDHVQAETAGLHGEVAAAGGDIDLLEGAEVEVSRGRAGRGHVGDHEAVERPDAVSRKRSLAGDAGLLAVLVARDVDAVNEGAGDLVHDAPGVARRRHVLEILRRQVRTGAPLRDVH